MGTRHRRAARHQPEQHVIFRHLGSTVPPDCAPDWNWQVEVHEGRGFPVGFAWVVAPPPGTTEPPPGWEARPTIKFVLVADDARRRGIATRLVEACRQRWPGAELSLPISPAGEALYRKVSPRVAPEDVFNKDFIASRLAAGASRTDLERLAAAHHRAMPASGATGNEADTRPVAAGKKSPRRSDRAGRAQT